LPRNSTGESRQKCASSKIHYAAFKVLPSSLLCSSRFRVVLRVSDGLI
jgi:hypothetical protein